MEIKFRGNILEIENARIIFRNFAGAPSKFNREGERDFSVIIPSQELADELIDAGYNVKIKPPREDGEDPFIFLKVKVKFNGRGPAAYIRSGDKVTKLTEETIGILDEIDIASVDMDIRGYDWEVNGNSGKTAYLAAIDVEQNIDRFGARYTAQELPF